MDKKILGMPVKCAIGVILTCLIGIIIGSFCDFQISVALANKTDIGKLFANYGGIISYFTYPIAGICLFKGIKRKGERWNKLANGLLFLAYFMGVYYCNLYFGGLIRLLVGYEPGVTSAFVAVLCYLVWVVLLAVVLFLANKLIDDKEANLLIATGAVILVAGLTSDLVNVWLKQVASRPRFRYLITLDNPRETFRNWWQMAPNLAESNDLLKSWPSGNMTIATMLFSLPLLVDVLKKKSERLRWSLFIFACIWVVLFGYNRIHMTAHFLSDVCFGTLITYVIYAVCSVVAIPEDNIEQY